MRSSASTTTTIGNYHVGQIQPRIQPKTLHALQPRTPATVQDSSLLSNVEGQIQAPLSSLYSQVTHGALALRKPVLVLNVEND